MAAGTRLRHPKFQSLDECLKNVYPIQVDLEYRLLNRGLTVKHGYGRTVMISSTGVVFESQGALPAGMRIEVSIAWPALLNSDVGIQLWARGRTAPARDRCTVVTFETHAFRTRSSHQGAFGEKAKAVSAGLSRL